jgi:hypothetical protein
MTIRLLAHKDLQMMEDVATKKFQETTDSLNMVFSDPSGLVFKSFVMPDEIYGSQRMRAFGYFNDDGELLGMIGIRNIDHHPSWVLSYIVTSVTCKNSIQVIKELLQHILEAQEACGKFQWFVVSKLDKFKSWQRLFNSARSNYHHYVYGRVPANTMPKWLNILQLSGNKLFPYDINISMYMSKKLCTSDNEVEFNEADCIFI